MPNPRKQKKGTNPEPLSLEEYLKQLPSPPPEHSHELEMEKRVKRLIAKQANKPK